MSSWTTQGVDIEAGTSFIVVDLAPGDGPALHRHPYAEVFVLLEGEAMFTIGDREFLARGGETVVAPANCAHRFINSGTSRLRAVNVHENNQIKTEWL